MAARLTLKTDLLVVAQTPESAREDKMSKFFEKNTRQVHVLPLPEEFKEVDEAHINATQTPVASAEETEINILGGLYKIKMLEVFGE